MPVNNKEDAVVSVSSLVKYFPVKSEKIFGAKKTLKAVDNISFNLYRKEILGIVGESGCGKSTTAKLVLNMIPPTSGSVLFNNTDITRLKPKKWRSMRLNMQMIFQDPLGALDPYISIGKQIQEPLDIHNIGKPGERKEKVIKILDSVSMQKHMYDRYPHEISGGQRQRAVLARALIVEPELLVCDEPISALDVSIQAQVVNLFKNIQKKLNITFMFISHDLRIVKHICNRVVVMYLGKIVEEADSAELYANTLHPYTKALISSIPLPKPVRDKERLILEGDPPSPIDLPSGCRFSSRCPYVMDRCLKEEPELIDTGNNHKAACFLVNRGQNNNAL